jgi:hypothetical protein
MLLTWNNRDNLRLDKKSAAYEFTRKLSISICLDETLAISIYYVPHHGWFSHTRLIWLPPDPCESLSLIALSPGFP